MRPDLDKPCFFNNASNHAVGFWGAYGVRPLTKIVTLDAYYLGLDRKTAAFNRGVGHEVRHSIGARLSRPVAEMNARLGISIMKRFGNSEILSVYIWPGRASETGYRFPNVPLKPRFSAKADISAATIR